MIRCRSGQPKSAPLTPAPKALLLDMVFMAAKENAIRGILRLPSLQCPGCRLSRVECVTEETARCLDCGRAGNVADWRLIEELRRHVARIAR